jgi:Peptidase family M28
MSTWILALQVIWQKSLMKRYILVFIVVFYTTSALAQEDSAIRYAEAITAEGLQKQLSVIASAEMEGRETGTEGQRRAAAYIQSQFKEAGLLQVPSLNGYQQTYPLSKDTLIPKTLKIGKKRYDFGTDYLITPGSADNNEFKSDNIIFAGYGIEDKNYDDYAGKEVKGKLVVIFSGEPKSGDNFLVSGTQQPSAWGRSINRKAVLANQKGAVALLFIDGPSESLSPDIVAGASKATFYFHTEKNNTTAKVPVVTIIPAVLRNIFGAQRVAILINAAKNGASLIDFKEDEEIKSKLSYQRKKTVTAASNVIGFIEGGDKKDEYVFLTAHYDHLGKRGNTIYFGADDDGSGTASVIEMAAAFERAKAAGFTPRRSIVFMTVSGEEKGLWGSEYYSDHPLFPLSSTSVDLNTDMIGRIDPGRNHGDSTNYIYVIGDDKLSTDLKPISISVNSTYPKLELDYKFNDPADPERIYYRSDHYNFARKGVPIIFFFDGIHKDYHRPTDTVDKINFDLMEKRVRYIFLIAWNMANRNALLKRDLALPAEH